MIKPALRIGFISDPSNRRSAETYRNLMIEGPYSPCCGACREFDPQHPERLTAQFSGMDVALATVGIPGSPGYNRQMHAFMDALASAPRVPATGLITHDAEHTRYVIGKWIESAPSAAGLPDGRVSIIDAHRPLRNEALARAVGILAAVAARIPAQPAPEVEVGSLKASGAGLVVL